VVASQRTTQFAVVVTGRWKCRSGQCGSRQQGWKCRRDNRWKAVKRKSV